MRHPYQGDADCPEDRRYQRSLPDRFKKEAQTLAQLTGWNLQDIRKKMNFQVPNRESWWKQLWK